ncbi:MAG: hypothetical protein JWQ19_1066 [Subtercola sp.]|nr:hypothetical protein [Subtercola sp.]
MTEPDDDLGLISGRYRLGELLGTGGSASVFEAVDTQAMDTQAVDTQAVDTQAVETQAVETQTVETQTVDSQAVDSQAVDTQAVDSQAVDSRVPGARPAAAGEGGAAGAASARAAPTIVALKILHPHLSRSASAREAFFVEAWAASKLRHPNIAGVLGVGVHDSSGEQRAWIAMQRAEGTSLAEFVDAHGALTVSQALDLADGVLQALEAAHALGLVHRDISPANIMIAATATATPPGAPPRLRSVQVVDFGLADAAGRPALGFDILRSASSSASSSASRRTSSRTSRSRASQGVLGSANYMAPEQALGLAVDERGDLYQLGAVLYFAVTGQPPFLRDSTSAVMRAHVTAPPPIASVSRPGIDRRFDRMIARAMLKDPALRPQSAAAFRAQVTELAAALDRGHANERVTVVHPADRTIGTVSTAGTVRMPAVAPPHTAPPTTSRSPGAVAVAPSAPVVASARRAGPTTTATTTAPRTRARSGGAIWLAAILTATVIAVVWVLGSNVSSSSSIAAPTVASTASPESSSPEPSPSGPGSSAAPQPSPTAAGVPTVTAPPPQTAPPGLGPALVGVPPVSLLSLADARLAAQARGLTIGAVTPQDSALPADTVLASDPAVGTTVPIGSVVNLTAASGSNLVPPIVSLTQAEAIDAVQAAGLVAVVTFLPSSSRTAGTVSSTSPRTGTRVALGSSVTIAVAQPPVPVPTTSATPGAPVPSTSPTATR